MLSDYNSYDMPSTPSTVITFIPPSRFDERGRQMQFVESQVQRHQRLAFLKAMKTGVNTWASSSETSSGRTSPTSSIRSISVSSSSCSSLSSSPTHSPFSEVLDITNTCPEPFLLYSSPFPSSGSSSLSMSLFSAAPPPPSNNNNNGNFKTGHRRQSSSWNGLHAIPEED